MHHRSRMSPLAVIALAILIAVLALGIAACGSSSTATTAAGGGNSTTAPASGTTAASPTTSAPVSSDTTVAAGPKELTVSAASSLKSAITEIGAAFDKANGSTTTFNFDASGTLQKQIEGGAPVDVFASAAMKQVTALKDAGLVDVATIKKFAGNEIVLVVPADSTLGLTGFQDLTKADVKKIGYGDPKVAPHGVAAEQILTKLGILDQVKSKVVYAQNVAQAMQYVTSGEVDAAILFATEAKAAGDKVKVLATADQSSYTPVAYPVAVVSASKVKDLGQAFVDFVAGPEGQAILAKYGFLPAPTDAATTSSS